MIVADDNSIREAVREYVQKNFLYARPDYALSDDVNLLDEGLMDSMGAVELVTFLQDRFSIAVSDDEITEDNFGTIAAIARFVAGRLPSSA